MDMIALKNKAPFRDVDGLSEGWIKPGYPDVQISEGLCRFIYQITL